MQRSRFPNDTKTSGFLQAARLYPRIDPHLSASISRVPEKNDVNPYPSEARQNRAKEGRQIGFGITETMIPFERKCSIRSFRYGCLVTT